MRKFLPLSLLAAVGLACTMSILPVAPPAPPATLPPSATWQVFPPTSTPTATPTPVPTPTPLPGVRIASGEHALSNGDWEAALVAFREAFDIASAAGDEEAQAAAQFGLGRTYFLMGDYAAALSTLRLVVEQYPRSPYLADAHFYLGEAYSALQRYSEAADEYLAYLAIRPGVIDAYIYELRGDTLMAAGDYPSALKDYLAALGSPRLRGSLALEIKIARSYALSGDYATALVMYDDLYNRAEDGYTKAQLDYLRGQAYAAIGQTDQAYTSYLDAVTLYPFARSAYEGLLILVNDGYPVDEYVRGLTDYYAGEYAVAIQAFDRYLANEASDLAPAAHYYKGLSAAALNNYTSAISEWEFIIQNDPTSDLWDDAWEQKAYYQWAYLDQYTEAQRTLLDFVTLRPNHPRAAEFLFDAARVAERNGALGDAATLWERVAAEYPSDERAYRSRFLASICLYRTGDYRAAKAAFTRLFDSAPNAGEQAAIYFWMGKSFHALRDEANAQEMWKKAAAADPTGYYSERAAEISSGKAPFSPSNQLDLGIDWQAERAEAETWLRTTFSLPADTNLTGLGALASDPRMIRGQEFWRLGLYAKARDEFEDLRQAVELDPADTFRLMNFFHEIGLYRSAILAARQVLALAGMDDAATLNAPRYFNHIRFGIHFLDLVIPTAQRYDFDPLFTWSVMRQESFFEPFIGSPAGARGLMQIIPATGQSLADQFGWPPNYTADDLYRPLVSITLGFEYLDQQRDYFQGDLYAALAAYNAGPGNAYIWQSLAQNDPDLLLEIIRLDEPRAYIKAIYEIYTIYRRLYDRSP